MDGFLLRYKKMAGAYMRTHMPLIYDYCILYRNRLRKRDRSACIIDSLGGSFKEYFCNEDMPARVLLLKKDTDVESQHTVDVLLLRLLNYPEARCGIKNKVDKKNVIGGLLAAEKTEKKTWIKSLPKYRIPSRMIESSVFYYNHGVELLPASVKDYIKNTDFVDLGAYIGDSVLALSAYEFRKIYSFDISEKSIGVYKQTMSRNHIPESKYEIIQCGVAKDDNQPPFRFTDQGSAGTSLKRNVGKGREIVVEQKSFDTLACEHHIEPRFIKADIEGAALDFVKGAERTLQKYRPVLSVAIYHNPYEFFEVKPFLESILTDYVYCIRKLSSDVEQTMCHSEICLLAYPKEILN